MAKHKTQRELHLNCRVCGIEFTTGSSIRQHCSIECRIKDAEKSVTETGCWEWVGSINPSTGYGQMSYWKDGKRTLHTAHRVSYSAYVSAIPKGLFVLHKCDNKKCFNPAHLFLGTQADNMADMMLKNRKGGYTKPAVSWHKLYPEKVLRGENHPMFGKKHMAGEKHPMSKISDKDAFDIRNSTEVLRVISERYGISQSAASCIRRGKTWNHLDSFADTL